MVVGVPLPDIILLYCTNNTPCRGGARSTVRGGGTFGLAKIYSGDCPLPLGSVTAAVQFRALFHHKNIFCVVHSLSNRFGGIYQATSTGPRAFGPPLYCSIQALVHSGHLSIAAHRPSCIQATSLLQHTGPRAFRPPLYCSTQALVHSGHLYCNTQTLVHSGHLYCNTQDLVHSGHLYCNTQDLIVFPILFCYSHHRLLSLT